MKITLLQPATDATAPLLPEGPRALRMGMAPNILPGDLNWLGPGADGKEQSYPLSVTFSWRTEGEEALYSEVRLSPREDLQDAWIVPGEGNSAQAYNLLIGTVYYWQVRVTSASGETLSPVGRFVTEDLAPRMIRAVSLSNIRDVGGWYTADGRRIRQGLMYRGSEMNDHHAMDEEARQVLRE